MGDRQRRTRVFRIYYWLTYLCFVSAAVGAMFVAPALKLSVPWLWLSLLLACFALYFGAKWHLSRM